VLDDYHPHPIMNIIPCIVFPLKAIYRYCTRIFWMLIHLLAMVAYACLYLCIVHVSTEVDTRPNCHELFQAGLVRIVLEASSQPRKICVSWHGGRLFSNVSAD
jgi:hypothetical protein